MTGGCRSSCIGGLCGLSEEGQIYSSYANSSVFADDRSSNVGGLCGSSEETQIYNCYATGSVTGQSGCERFGGLCGYIRNGILSNCYAAYAAGSISWYYTGGLVGFNDGGEVTNSFWDTETSGTDWSHAGTGKTTAEMKQQSTFTDWDFINVWNIGQNQTYPYLRTVPAGDINKDKTVNFLDVCIIAEKWCEEE